MHHEVGILYAGSFARLAKETWHIWCALGALVMANINFFLN